MDRRAILACDANGSVRVCTAGRYLPHGSGNSLEMIHLKKKIVVHDGLDNYDKKLYKQYERPPQLFNNSYQNLDDPFGAWGMDGILDQAQN